MEPTGAFEDRRVNCRSSTWWLQQEVGGRETFFSCRLFVCQQRRMRHTRDTKSVEGDDSLTVCVRRPSSHWMRHALSPRTNAVLSGLICTRDACCAYPPHKQQSVPASNCQRHASMISVHHWVEGRCLEVKMWTGVGSFSKG